MQPSNLSPRYLPEWNENYGHKIGKYMFIGAILFEIAKNWKPKWTSPGKWKKNLGTMEYYLGIKSNKLLVDATT